MSLPCGSFGCQFPPYAFSNSMRQTMGRGSALRGKSGCVILEVLVSQPLFNALGVGGEREERLYRWSPKSRLANRPFEDQQILRAERSLLPIRLSHHYGDGWKCR